MNLAAEQALRAGQIVRRLREFIARDGEADKRVEDLAKLAEEAGELALVGARELGVCTRFRFDPHLPPVLVDRIQIQQVLLNLIRNSLEAMALEEGEGETMGRCLDLTVAARASGPSVVEVTVSDTGPGLAPEISDCVFSPFVSTKPGGMGMGLAICRSIIDAHGGRLWAEANPGGGAVFRFELPAAPLDAAAQGEWEEVDGRE
jgi:two-component system sensor kinase FixL